MSENEMHTRRHEPSLKRVKEAHSWMPTAAWSGGQEGWGHRAYTQSADEQCYLCAVIAKLERAETINADLLAALQAVVSDIREYERINNLAPNPGRQNCWDSVSRAQVAIARAQGKG